MIVIQSTISFRHRIIPIVGSSLHGSLDSAFQWSVLEIDQPYEGAFLSSPGIREDGIITQTVGAIYAKGHIDCGYAEIRDTRWTRPALFGCHQRMLTWISIEENI